MFQCRICPISTGTPQELAYAESGIRNLAKISRAMLMGAPHLPKWAWGLADGYATYVHDVLPQKSKGNKSPFKLRNGYAPDLRHLFIKTFGAPLQYAPLGGAEHKRGKITEWGWFMGMEWPFVLVATKVENWSDVKIINVSRKKVRVYEGKYAMFDPQSTRAPNFVNFEIDDDNDEEVFPSESSSDDGN